jgi:hypothetical protein
MEATRGRAGSSITGDRFLASTLNVIMFSNGWCDLGWMMYRNGGLVLREYYAAKRRLRYPLHRWRIEK